jgi:hypothetical protein
MIANGARFVTVSLKIPDGPSCLYLPQKEGDEHGPLCEWLLRHFGSRQCWCRIFDTGENLEEIRIINMRKCKACRDAISESAGDGIAAKKPQCGNFLSPNVCRAGARIRCMHQGEKIEGGFICRAATGG